MPTIKSAKKALRQSVKRKARKLVKKKEIKATVKEFKKMVEKKDSEGAKKLLPKFYKIIDKTAKTGFIKKNTASRKKSRITKMINKIS